MVWNSDWSVQNNTQHKSASNTHKIPLRKRYTASDELDVIQLQTSREKLTSDPSVLLKLYQTSPRTYRRSYILEG